MVLLFFAMDREILRRLVVLAVVVTVVAGIGYGALHLFRTIDGRATGLVPAAVDDPVNRGVFIAGGTFMRGTDDVDPDVDPASPYSTADEYPARETTVESFWMQEHEVTNAEFRRFDPSHPFPPGHERHPVVGVTWRQAVAYAESIGGSLPDEWQWEYAARGSGNRVYPWGDEEPTCARAQFADCEPRGTMAVMSRPAGATPDGIHDLAGNAWEWVVPGWFEAGRTPVNTASRRLRGGSFDDAAFFLRAANRNNDFHAGFTSGGVGFRVVWQAR